jgi:hypothetical protein
LSLLLFEGKTVDVKGGGSGIDDDEDEDGMNVV